MPLDLAQSILLRWPNPEADHVALLRKAGIEAVVTDSAAPGFQYEAEGAGIQIVPPSAVAYGATRGLWPGIRRQPNVRDRGDETVSASREPWVDSNGYLASCERALHPERPALLAYQPDTKSGLSEDRVVPYETLELALLEARLYGGNYLLAVEPRYRAALLAGDNKALEAWQSLGRTGAWLKKHAGLCGRPAFPGVTVLVEEGYSSLEIANLLCRRGASPAIHAAARPPAPQADRILALVAAGLKSLPAGVLAHAAAGSTVVIDSRPDPVWKLVKRERDRTFYSYGKGQILAYHKPVSDPSEFALDVIDIVTHRRRTARVWNALASVWQATEGAAKGEALLHIINYGSSIQDDVQARIQGRYSRALLLRPEGEPAALKVYSRGSMTEVFLPGLLRAAVIQFS